MDLLVGGVRRQFSGSRNKSRCKSEPGSGTESPDRLGSGFQGQSESGIFSSPLLRRISASSPKLGWTTQQEDGGQKSKRRNSSFCLPTSRHQSSFGDGSSDTTTCSSMEFLPGTSLQMTPALEQVVQASQEQLGPAGPKLTPVKRRDRLEAVKARVTAKRNSYKDDSSSSDGEQELIRSLGKDDMPRFLSDEALHRPGRGRYSRRARRKPQCLEGMSRTQVTRSDPQLPFEDRYPISWMESTAYQEPLQHDDGHSQSTSEDIPSHCSIERTVASSLLPPQAPNRTYMSAPLSVRKPLTISVHGIAGHFPPASPCDSGLGSHSMTSSPSLGRAPSPPLKSPTPDLTAHRLPPSLISTRESKSAPSTVSWLHKKQNLLSQMASANLEVTSSRLVSQVCSDTDQEHHTPLYLSDSQIEQDRNYSHRLTQNLNTWKVSESSRKEIKEHNGRPASQCLTSDAEDATRRKGQKLNHENGLSVNVRCSQDTNVSPRNSPLSWSKGNVLSEFTAKTGTPDKRELNSAIESTTKSTHVSPRSWIPFVQPRNPNRISAAEALGVKPAIPPPPVRVGSLGNTRRSVDTLSEKEKRKRCSEYLDEALNELETIYQSLRLNDDDELLDRAERRDMPEWRPAFGLKNRGSRQKRFSIADPTGFSFLDGSLREHGLQPRRSAVPDKVADDLAVRKLQQRPSAPRRKFPVEAATSPSYLLFSPMYTPSLYVKPANRDVTSQNEPDPELDDVGYRKLSQSQRQLPPHPPFGIPLDPSSRSPSRSYIYAESSDKGRVPDWRSSKKNVQADPLRDDLAFRNLRRDSLRRSSSILSETEDWYRPEPPQMVLDRDESVANIVAALQEMGQRSPPPIPKRRHFPSSGQKRLHGLTHRT